MKVLLSVVFAALVGSGTGCMAAETKNAGTGQSTTEAQAPACSDTGVEHKLTPSEVKELLRSASSQVDHLQLAAYFKEEAAQEKAAADLDDRMATEIDFTYTESHWRRLANNARRAERHAMKMADEHERIAQAMQNGAPFGTRYTR